MFVNLSQRKKTTKRRNRKINGEKKSQRATTVKAIGRRNEFFTSSRRSFHFLRELFSRWFIYFFLIANRINFQSCGKKIEIPIEQFKNTR